MTQRRATVARLAHNPEVAGSTPAAASVRVLQIARGLVALALVLCFVASCTVKGDYVIFKLTVEKQESPASQPAGGQ